MKPFLEVEKNRVNYHKHLLRNTVHRSSLLVPRFQNILSNITFLNHFLLKRNNQNVIIKITAMSKIGQLYDSISLKIDQPKVYSFFLEDLFDSHKDIGQYNIEFFSSQNLFIPFPAVMVNHIGQDFVNSVHSYNRLLNDVFEDDQVNDQHVLESSVDIFIDDNHDTFFNFMTGPFDIEGTLGLSLKYKRENLNSNKKIKLKRLTNKNFYLSKDFRSEGDNSKLLQFKNLEDEVNPILRISQPKQKLFYGRMLSGIIHKKTKAFSANHTYYDSSKFKEYFDNSESFRTYPYFKNCKNQIKMYPIMSPSKIEVYVEVYDDKRKYISESKYITSPSNESIYFDIDQIVSDANFKNTTLYKIFAKSVNGKIPTRVTHQLIYGSENSVSKLDCSIAINLANKKIFKPKSKKGLCWGQVLCDKEYRSFLGLSFNDHHSKPEVVKIDFYNRSGKLKSIKRTIHPKQSLILNDSFFHKINTKSEFIWFIAASGRSDLSAKIFHFNKISNNASGEHSF